MKLLSEVSAVGLVAWLADFYLLATLLMLVALAARRLDPAAGPAADRQLGRGGRIGGAGPGLHTAFLAPDIHCSRPYAEKPAVETPVAADPTPIPGRDAANDLAADAQDGALLRRSADSRRSRIDRAAGFSPVPLVLDGTGRRRVPCLRRAGNRVADVGRSGGDVGLPTRGECAGVVAQKNWRGSSVTAAFRGSWSVRAVTTAVALGLRRPTIVLPAGLLAEGPPQALRAVLTHEWAHIRNGDLRLLALGRCLLVLLFAHPLFWWLRRAIRGDQELLADAAAAGDDRPAYAEELLRLARKTAWPSPLAASVPSEYGRVRLNFQGELPCFWTKISTSSLVPRAVGGIGLWVSWRSWGRPARS